jgi:hypothetical protein
VEAVEIHDDIRLLNCMLLAQPTTRDKIYAKNRQISGINDRIKILLGDNPYIPTESQINKTREIIEQTSKRRKESE